MITAPIVEYSIFEGLSKILLQYFDTTSRALRLFLHRISLPRISLPRISLLRISLLRQHSISTVTYPNMPGFSNLRHMFRRQTFHDQRAYG